MWRECWSLLGRDERKTDYYPNLAEKKGGKMQRQRFGDVARIWSGSTPVMKVRGIAGLTLAEMIDQVRRGARFVVFAWSVGIGVASVRRASAVYFICPGQRALWKHLGCTLATVALGWWAIPRGPSCAMSCLRQNFRGGEDVTAGVLQMLVRANARIIAPAAGAPVVSAA